MGRIPKAGVEIYMVVTPDNANTILFNIMAPGIKNISL